MKEESKAGVVSGIQQLESTFGVGDGFSSCLDDVLNTNEEQEENQEETINLGTGLEITVPEGEVIEDRQATKGEKCLIVLASITILPVVVLSTLFLSSALIGIQKEFVLSHANTQPPLPFSTTPDYFIECEYMPQLPKCQELYGRTVPTTTTTPSSCDLAPWRPECQSPPNNRRKRSVSLCDFYPWAEPCPRRAWKRRLGRSGRKNEHRNRIERDKRATEAKEYGLDSVSRGSSPNSHTSAGSDKAAFDQVPLNKHTVFGLLGIFFKGQSVEDSPRVEKRGLHHGHIQRKMLSKGRIRTNSSSSYAYGRKVLAINDYGNGDDRDLLHRMKRSDSEYADGDAPPSEELSPPNLQTVQETYQVIFGLFGIVSGILITAFSYRVVAMTGAFLSAIGSVIAADIPVSKEGMTFSIGFLTGVGNNFLWMSVTVAVLEYFKENRFRILLLSSASSVVASLLVMLTKFLLATEHGLDIDEHWRSLLLYQMATYIVICGGGGAMLIPRNLRMQDDPEQTFRSRALNITGLHLLKSPVLYLLAAVFFFHSLGGGLPTKYVDAVSAPFIFPLPFMYRLFILTGLLIGSLIGCCCRKLTLRVGLITIASLGLLMGALTLTVEGLSLSMEYAIVYCGLYGIFYGLRTPMLDFIVPLVMGEDHLGLSVGLTQFAAGVGSIIGGESSGAMAHMHGVFYFAGTALVLSGVCAVVLHVKVAARVMVKDLKQEDPPENGQARDIRDGEGPGHCALSTLGSGSLGAPATTVSRPAQAERRQEAV